MNSPTHQQEAILIAQQKLKASPVYLDTETTGLEQGDEIVEIAIIDDDGSPLLDSLVKPVGNISQGASAVHGINAEMLKDSPTWAEIWPQVQEALNGKVVGIYNADFDIRMMQQSSQKYGIDWEPPYKDFYCIMKMYAQFYGDWNSYRRSYKWQGLDAARRQCDLALPNSHRAKDDTLLAREVLHFMANQKV
jgi:DNA polymerase-3 subunit epsilon